MKNFFEKIKIRPSQIWKNRKTGALIEIIARGKDGQYHSRNMRYNQGILSRAKIAHHIHERDLYKYWEIQKQHMQMVEAEAGGGY